ncbi:hypothetical protein IG193_04585 [Infirmifilum lucidum]|uniref:Uncharacterized protein n=1 Tax=Infirmifilum lucidum TaxID=2776706 RepID=A0A7L9FH05_9CREN|nr:hypothetical protein [Infirmifilum lucidum]QOJ78075.1 hypothetical protein IG193_04585 [Infirmifilum lucidum]
MPETKSLYRFLLDAVRVFKAINDAINSVFPQTSSLAVTEPIYKRVTAFKERVENIGEERKVLIESGYGELVEKISEASYRVLIGFLSYYGEDGEAVYRAFEESLELPECSHVVIEDFSTDSLTASFLIDKHRPNRVMILTLKRRGRLPGVYRQVINLRQPDKEDAPEAARASLEGSLDIDHFIRGLGVFSPNIEVEVIECDPGDGEASPCFDKLLKVVEEEYNRWCR